MYVTYKPTTPPKVVSTYVPILDERKRPIWRNPALDLTFGRLLTYPVANRGSQLL